VHDGDCKATSCGTHKHQEGSGGGEEKKDDCASAQENADGLGEAGGESREAEKNGLASVVEGRSPHFETLENRFRT
jgi:hypothetical protein